MRFFDDGPVIPSHLIEQQRFGNVIFFCGAGISMPAGLQSFWGLTKQIIERLNAEKAMEAFKNNEGFDRVFNLLAREFGRPQIDQEIYKTLKTPRRAKIDCHRWIMNLSRGPHGRPQIVTTNFDLLFEKVDRRIPRIMPPSLPDLDLQPQLDGIVYLHGRLTKPAAGTTANYVISSSDFGRAYLSEGWAGRFVKALREKFTLVFLGYTASDPPMRYLLEGLNTKGSEAFDSPIYAFVPGDAGNAEEEWGDRGVTPICYDDADHHSALWKTIEAWSDAVADTVAWDAKLLSLAQRFPSELAPHERGQVAQLVSTKRGAKLFADVDPPPPAEWLCVFDNNVRYAKPRAKIGEDSGEIDPLAVFGLDDDPPRPEPKPVGSSIAGVNLLSWREGDTSFPERTTLLGAAAEWSQPLPERLFHIARWFARVCDQPAAIWWAAGWRTLNVHQLWHVERRVEDSPNGFALEALRFWRLYLEFHMRSEDSMDFEWYGFRKRLTAEGWTTATLRAFERLTEPRIELERYSYGAPQPPKKAWDKLRPSSVYQAEVRVLDRHGDSLDIPDDGLIEIVTILRRSLIHCSHLLEEAQKTWWRSPTLHPTGDKGESFPGRKTLHFLWFKELFDRLLKHDPVAAKTEMSRWPQDDRYFFGKLHIYAGMFPELTSAKEAEHLLLGLTEEIFWMRENQRELLFTLRARWPDLAEPQKRRIEKRLVAGPAIWDDEEPADFKRRRATESASRLRWLQLEGCHLSQPTAARLEKLKAVDRRWNDEWAKVADDSLGPRGGTVERVTELRGLDQLDINEIIPAALTRTEDNWAELRDFRPFEGLVAAFPFRALSSLRYALKTGQFEVRFWQNLLSAWPEETSERLRWFAAETLARLSASHALDLRYYLPRWVRSHLPALAEIDRPRALRIFDAIVAPYLVADADQTSSGIGHTSVGGVVQTRSEVSVNKAINSPTGILAEFLWALLPSKASRRRAMPKDVGDRLERLFTVPGDGGGHAVCIVARHMGWLDYCYSGWMTRVMLPLFEISHPMAEAAWHGIAYDRNRLKPATLQLMRDDFLAMLQGEADWTLDESEKRSHVQRLVGLARPRRDGSTIISFPQVQAVLMALSDDDRGNAIWTLSHILEANENGDQWEAFIKPFIVEAWPRQIRFRTERTSRGFARLVETAGEHFSDAVSLLLELDLLRPVAHLDMITYRLSKQGGEDEKDFAIKYPRATLMLLDALIADDRSQRPYELGKALEVLSEADPGLRQTNAWRRLQELTL